MYFVIENVTIYIERDVLGKERSPDSGWILMSFHSFNKKSAYNFALGKIMNS